MRQYTKKFNFERGLFADGNPAPPSQQSDNESHPVAAAMPREQKKDSEELREYLSQPRFATAPKLMPQRAMQNQIDERVSQEDPPLSTSFDDIFFDHAGSPFSFLNSPMNEEKLSSDSEDLFAKNPNETFYLDLDDPLFANIDAKSLESTNSSNSNDVRLEASFKPSQTLMNTAHATKPKVSSSKIKIEFSDGRVYEGQSMDGLPHGVGRMHYPDGTIFTGPFNQGNRHGRGRILFPNGNGWRQVVYAQDQLVRGGYAQMIKNGCRYVGFMSRNDQSLRPTCLIFPKDDIREWYRGSLNSEWQPHGPGKMKFLNSTIVEGEFGNGWPVGDRRSIQRQEPSPPLDSSNSNHSEPHQNSNSDTDSAILAASSPSPEEYSFFSDSPIFASPSIVWPDSFNLPDDFN